MSDFGSIQVMYDIPNALGIVANYHKPGVQAAVQSQLAQCAASGQTHMGLHLRHEPWPVANPSWAVPSSFEGQYLENFQQYLADFATHGFQHLTVSIGYLEGQPFDEVALANNLGVIVKLWRMLWNSQIPEFDIDPYAEGSPRAITPPDAIWFLDELWTRLCRELKGPTHYERMCGLTGYSNVDGIDPQEYVDGIKKIYTNGQMPNAWNIHCYRPENLPALRNAMTAANLWAYYIGESGAQDLVYPVQDFLWRNVWQTTIGNGDFSTLATGKYLSA